MGISISDEAKLACLQEAPLHPLRPQPLALPNLTDATLGSLHVSTDGKKKNNRGLHALLYPVS